jgi:hypothetical protein
LQLILTGITGIESLDAGVKPSFSSDEPARHVVCCPALIVAADAKDYFARWVAEGRSVLYCSLEKLSIKFLEDGQRIGDCS